MTQNCMNFLEINFKLHKLLSLSCQHILLNDDYASSGHVRL